MKALLSHEAGDADSLRLEDVADPVPGAGQVLVRVQACGVNYPDALLIADRYQVRPQRPFAPGGEVCGVVEALGNGVRGFAVGETVIGRCGWGGMAEKIALDASRCTRLPEGTPVLEAAAFLFTYATAYHALRDGAALRSGETLLVLGAAGGVGQAALDLGRAMGARVLAGVSSEDKLAFARQHGAADGVVYPRHVEGREAERALTDMFKALVGPRGTDVILDPVGGVYTEAALRAMARHGRLLTVGFTAGIPRLPLNLVLLKCCRVMGVDWRALNEFDPEKSAANNADLLQLWAAGRIRPSVSASYPLERGAEAIRALSERRALGKLVIKVS